MNSLAFLLSLIPIWSHPLLTQPVYHQPVDIVIEMNDMTSQLQRQWDLFNMRNPFSSEYDSSFNLVYPIEHPDSIQVIVNRLTKLDKDYEPQDLVFLSDLDPSLPARMMRQEAAHSFVRMKKAVFEATNITLSTNSAYRSYSTQVGLFNRYAQLDGYEEANTYSAIPGHSEHQTGLAIDITLSGKPMEFGESSAYPWVKKNAHKFGFIERYPENKSFITGYIYEPWHWRYVGVELATYLYHTQMTLDEYWIHGLIKYNAFQKP